MNVEQDNRVEVKIDALSRDLNHHMLSETKLQTGLLYTLVGHTIVGIAFIAVFTWHFLNQLAIDTEQRHDISKLQTDMQVINTRVNTLEERNYKFP